MARHFKDHNLIIASHNIGKVKEIEILLKPFDILVSSVGDLNLAVPVEDGNSFEENALIKAHAAAKSSGQPALADDSGLEIDSLNGDPGLYSADWAGPEKNFSKAMEKVLFLLQKAQNRSARFTCVLALAWPDGHSEVFKGHVTGSILKQPRGKKGFGYDPIFLPDGFSQSFAELKAEEKQSVSHRARAFDLMIAACFDA